MENIYNIFKKNKYFILVSVLFILVLVVVQSNINTEMQKIHIHYDKYITDYCDCYAEKKPSLNVNWSDWDGIETKD